MSAYVPDFPLAFPVQSEGFSDWDYKPEIPLDRIFPYKIIRNSPD